MPEQPTFGSAADVDRFFNDAKGRDFVTWFKEDHAGQGAWDKRDQMHAGAIQSLPNAIRGCREVCDNLPAIFGRNATLDEFLCLASIIINETATFLPITEGVGTAGHPGISYAFDAIANLKGAYNVGPLNKTAGLLFRDPEFLAAHGHRTLADRLRNTTDPRWDGTVYPQNEFPTSRDPNDSGIILEADFFKFRGRGLIQTTWRANYLPLISFIQNNASPQPVMVEYRQRWAGLDPDVVATRSSNDDWDRLFQQTDCIVATAAIRIHSAAAGSYLQVSQDEAVFGSGNAGSAYNVGRRVSGKPAYGRLFRDRVFQLRNDLPRISVEEPPMKPHSVQPEWWNLRTIPASAQRGSYMMRAGQDFALPANATRVRFGVFVADCEGYIRFFNADGSEAAPAGWGKRPVYSTVEVTTRDGSVPFRVEDGAVTTEMIRSLGYWT